MIENDAFKLLLINLFHLNPNDITNIVCTTFNKMMVLLVTLADKHQACPYCGFTAPKIKEYVTKEITHSALTTQKCIIKYRARRYKCQFRKTKECKERCQRHLRAKSNGEFDPGSG